MWTLKLKLFLLKSLLIIICMAYILNPMDISFLLERVKDHSMLNGDKTILGINTLCSTLLLVARYPSIYFGYTTCIPAMQVCLKYIATCYYSFMPAIWIYTVY